MKTLECWFPKDKHDFSDFKYTHFYLNWSSGKKPESVEWLESPPSKYNFSKIVFIRIGQKKFKINIVGNLDLDHPESNPFIDLETVSKDSNYREYSNSSLLKSIIQKSVRRKNTQTAILASFHLMRLDFMEFIRRFPIICCEDSCLHSSMSVVIWMMMASPQLKLKKVYIQYLLGIVYLISESVNYDRSVTQHLQPSELIEKIYLQVPSSKTNLLLSLFVRKCYGGMKGDMIMIGKIIEKWIGLDIPTRFNNPIRPIQIRSYLNYYSIPYYCVDFHCYQGIIDKIQLSHPELSFQSIRSAIWHGSSKINYRIKDDFIDTNWKKIENDYIKIISGYLKYNI